MLVLVIVAVLFLAGSVVLSQLGKTTAQTQTQVVTDQRDATAAQAQGLAAQIKIACQQGSLPQSLCVAGEKVAADPVPGPAGATGPRGAQGDSVIGPQGLPGAQGPIGPVGPQGEQGPQGVAGAQGDTGTSGTDGQAGAQGQQGDSGQQGPIGPAGQNGSPAASYAMTFPDGSTQTCTRDGGTDMDPHYQCAAVVPAPSGGGLLGG